MARNRQEFTYAINADTSKAKKQIADLFKSLDNVQKYSLDNFNIAPDLVKASHAAEELAGHLRMATNVNTGQLDLAKFNQSIRNSNTSLTELISNLGQGGSAGQAAFEQMTAAIARTQVPLRQTSALLKDMATTLKNTVKWELSSSAVHGLESALSGAVSYAKNLNTSLTNIRIVTGQSVEDMARFTKEANAAAKALSTTTKSYTDASLIYYQQGDSQEMAAKKAAITIKAANASFETSAKEMSEYLTSVWNSYQVGADELERYVDIMANLGAKTATSLEEIATSMQKVAATSNTVGVSMEQVSSIIATVSSVTRESAESIGTSYKTIFARIGDLKLGKADEDGIGLGQVSSQLDAIGVKILDESGNLRDMGNIIMDLGAKWQTMNQAQKTAVAQVVAGKRQYTQLMALFENWDMFQANLNLAENSEGALQGMADIYAESWEAASARVQASMEGIFNSIINDQGLIKLTNFTADFVDGIGSAIDSIGGLNGVLRLTGSILMKTFSKEAGARIKDLGRSVAGMFQDPKKNYQQASQQMREQLADINNKKQVDAQIQLIDAKNQLLQVEEYLSATQKQVAQASIADIESQVNKVKELEDAYTDLRNDVANVNLNRLGASQDSFGNTTFEEEFKRLIENQYKDIYSDITSDTSLQGAYNALLKNSQMAGMGNQGLAAISPENLAQYDNLEQRMSIVRQEAEGLRSMMEELGITIDGMPIERLNQMLEKTDWNDEDIEALRNALEQLERTGVENCTNLERVINKFLEEASQAGFAAEDIERLRQAFERVSAAGDDLANAQRKVAAASESLSQKTDKLNHSLDRQAMSFEKAVESALDLGSGALDLINGFSAMSDVTAQWGDESLSLADKLGSLLSTVLSLGMAIPSLAKGLAVLIPALAGGPAVAIAAIAALGAGAFGVISGQEKAKKTEYQKEQKEAAEKRTNNTNQRDEELNNIQTLMKNYNTLRETYLTTGEGQDALAASARALADAYDLVGANLLIAEGNFTAFEQMLARSTGLNSAKKYYQDQINSLTTELNGDNDDSIYFDQGERSGHWDLQERYRQSRGYQYTDTELNLGTEDLSRQIQIISEQRAENYKRVEGLLSLQEIYQGPQKDFAFSSFSNGYVPNVSTGMQANPEILTNWAQEMYNYITPELLSLFTDITGLEALGLDDIKQQIASRINPKTGIISSEDIQSLQDYIIKQRADYIALILNEDGLTNYIEQVKKDLNIDHFDSEILYREGLIDNASSTRKAALNKQMADITGATFNEQTGAIAYTDYWSAITDKEGQINFETYEGGKEAWYNAYLETWEASKAEQEKIEQALANGVEDESLKNALEFRLKYLKNINEEMAKLEDADYTAALEQKQHFQDQINQIEAINKVIINMLGHSEADSSFTDFNKWVEQLQTSVEATKMTDERFKGLVDAQGNILDQEAFNQVRDQIVAGYISDFTAFDDYLTIYQNIAAVFSGNDFTKAMSYIDAQEIKNSREVNSRLLNAMQRDIQNGEMGATADDVLAYNRQTLAGEKAIADYQTMSSLASSYKEDLNLTDAQGLLSILQQELDDGTNAWNDFIQMDFDQRQAYLQAREESALRAAQETQKQIAEEAVEKQKSLYYSEETYNRDKIGLQTFLDTHTKQADGTYTNNQTGNVVDSVTAQHWNNVSARIADYDQYGLDAENALAVADAIELILTQTAGLSEQMQTLVADFEQFNKTGRVSADVMKKMAEWGIDGSKIKTAQDYLKVMKSIYTQAKTNASTAEQNYLAMVGDNEYDWSNEQVQKDHAEEYAAWQEMMRLKQIEYDTEEQYNTTRQGYLDSELAKHQQILSQMREKKSLAEEEANKTQQLAEAMSAAIQTGNLSESARVGMDPELLNAWDNAADATERGAIAAQAWNKYATQMSLAGEDLNTLYNNASNALNALINNQGKYGLSDLINFNFADNIKGKSDFAEFISQQVKDPAAQAIWNEGFESLISHTNISNMSDLDILTKVKDEIIKAGNITEEEFNRILAGVRDNIASTFEQLAQQNIDAAQKAADAWLTAFNTIKNARQTLLSGGNILDQIAGDPDAIFDLMQSTGKGAQELYDMILKNDKEGLLTATSNYMNSGDYLKNLMGSKGYVTSDFGQKNRLRDIHSLGYSVKNGKWVDSTGAETDIAKIQENLAQHYAKLLQSTEKLDPESALAKARQLATGEIDYSDLSEEAKLFADALNISTEALKEQTRQQELAADVAYKGDASNLTKEQIETEGALVNGQVGTYDEYQKLATAITNAQEAKYNEESWDSLAQSDRNLLDKYNINFNNVDTAATDCASALAACAQAAYQLALASAMEQGYAYDSKTGIYTKDGNEVTAQNDDTVKYLEESRLNAEKLNANVSDVSYKTYERIASSVGMTVDEFEALKKSIEDADDSMTLAEKDINEVARATAKASQGLKELKDDFDENAKTLKNADKHSNEYIKAMSKMRKQLSDIFDTDEKFITDEFVEENIENMEKMANGTEEEAKAAAEAISDNLVKQIFEMEDIKDTTITVGADTDSAEMTVSSFFTDFMDQYDNVEIGTHIDTGPAIDALNTILSTGQMTADQVSAALAAIGWEPTIEWQYFDAQDKMVATSSTQYRVGETIVSGNGTQTLFTEGMYAVPVIKGTTKKGTGASAPKSGGGKKSGGGGGGSDKKETKDKIRGRDEIERYHKQNDTLDRIASTLAGIDKLKERAYGKDHIAQIEAETDALNKQLIAQQDLHNEALKWMAADKADLAKYGAEYDENGTIVNYERVMERIIDEYNSAIERYNNSGQGDGDKLALEAAEQIFEDAKKAIENYEEALGIANDSANEMLEIQNQMSELEVEKITYELELKMEMNERDLEMLEYYQEKHSEELEHQDKLFNTFIQSAAEYEDNLAQLGKAYEDLSRQYAAGLINEAHYAEAVTELQGEIVDNLNSLQEIQNELAEAYSETLELAREEIERTTDAIDHSNEALQSFMDITRLTGNDTEYKKIGKFYDQMYANNLTKIEVQKAHLDSLLEEEERFQEKIRNGQQLTELEKAEYAALSEQIQETRDTLLSSVVESLEVVRESYENTINSIADDLDNFMAGAAGSMEYLQEQYGYFQEEQERYVSTTKELYEVSKLNRDIEGTLATTTSSAAKEALKALQEKINKQSELNELTEYDIEMNQLQYQLLLARIKLEESQNAKDTVRLTRDENGNYAYRYTANQDKIDEAAQHYEDVLQQINDTTVQRTSEIEQQLLNTMSNYKEKFQEIATDYSLTEEERLMRLEELNNQFSETMRYLQEQNNIVTNNLTANQEAIAGHYGATMSEITASTAGNVNNTIQSMIDKTEEYIAAMNNAIFGEEGAQSAWQKYLAQLGDIEGSADVAYDSLLGNAQEMGEMNGFAAEEALEVIQTLRDTLDPLEALSSAWDAHNAILEATISNYENLAQVIQGALSAIGQIPNGGTANVDGAHRYAKGGLVDYTGLAWVDGTASDPEMMLNPGDTQNILKATATVKSLDSGFIGSLVESVKSAAAAMLHMFGGAYHAVTNVHTANDSALDQNVHITAEFPNVQNHTEIEEAFDNLINQAAQFAHRKN